MRVKIFFDIQTQEDVFPHYHQNLLAAWVESIKVKSDHWCAYTHYNFSSLRGQTASQRAGLSYLTSKVMLVLSSLQPDFIDFLVTQIFEQPTWQLGGIQLTPSHVSQEPPIQLSNAMKYLCIAPLVPSWNGLQDEKTGKMFVHPRQDDFSDLLYECTMVNMEHSGLYSPEVLSSFFKFQLVPDQGYLNRIKQQGKLFARVHFIAYQDKEYETRTYIFPFTLHADKEVQEYVYTHGLGALSQQGLGMLDVRDNLNHTATREGVAT